MAGFKSLGSRTVMKFCLFFFLSEKREDDGRIISKYRGTCRSRTSISVVKQVL